MEMTWIVSLVSTGAVSAMLFALLLQRRRCRNLECELEGLKVRQTKTESEIEVPEVRPFAEDLERAEHQHIMARPQREGTTERYRYISAMARQGVTPAQIAAALQVGEAEAEQIVRLTQLQAKKYPPENHD